MAVARGCSNVRKKGKRKIRNSSQHRECSLIIYLYFLSTLAVSLWWRARRGLAGSLWENRQCLICYDMNTQLDHRVQILQSAVRCQAALRGSSSGSEPVTHHIKITGESEAFFLSNHFSPQGGRTRRRAFIFIPLNPCFLGGTTKKKVLWSIWKPRKGSAKQTSLNPTVVVRWCCVKC